MKKIISILLLCSITACQLFSKSTVVDSEIEIDSKQVSVTTSDYPPLLLTINPEPGTTIQLNQRFNLEFSEEMDKKSVEAAFKLKPLVAGRFEWVDEKLMSFVPDQELPIGQKISLELNTNASNISGKTIEENITANYQVTEPLRVGYKYPISDDENVDTNTNRVYLTFNQPVVEKLIDAVDLPAAFRIIPDQQGSGKWINNSTYMYFLDHGLTGGTDFRVEINRNLKSVNNATLEISPNTNWQFKTIEPGIVGYFPTNNSTIPLDQTFRLIFNQSMQSETVASKFLFHDVSGQPVSGRFYWNELDTEMTFIPEKLLERGTTYLMELLPESQVKGGNVFQQQISISFTTIKDFNLEKTIPENQQPIDMVNGKSAIILVFSSELNESTEFSKFISVFPEVLDLEIYPGNLKNELVISGSMKAGQTYKVLISESLKDRWGSYLGEAIINEYFVSPPEPALIFQDIVETNIMLVSEEKPIISAEVTNIDHLSLTLGKLEFSEFAVLKSGQPLENLKNNPKNFQINTNVLPNRKKLIEIDLIREISPLNTGIYNLEIESANGFKKQIFILVQRNKIYSKFSGKQLLIWSPFSSSVPLTDDQLIKIYDDSFQLITTANPDSDGVKIIDPFLYSSENSNYWIEYGFAGDINYSLYYSGWNFNEDQAGIEQDYINGDIGIGSFFISDKNIYQPGDLIKFYAIIRSIIDDDYVIPEDNKYYFFMNKANSDITIGNQEISLSEFGTLDGVFQIPENLTDGLYDIGLDPDLKIYKQIYIEKRPENRIDYFVNFESDRYKIGDDISLIIETHTSNIIESEGIPINWSIELVPIEDTFGIQEIYNPETILTESKLLIDGIGNLGVDGNFFIQINGKEIVDRLPHTDISYQLIARVEIFYNEFLPYTIRSQSILYPENYIIEIEANSFYLGNPEFIPIHIRSLNWDHKMIGAINYSVLMQKAISGDVNNVTGDWGDLYTTNLRTNGNGIGNYEAFINGPGIYRLIFRSGKLKHVRMIYVGGQGKIQYPIKLNGNLPIILDKSNFAIGETAKIFIPNPFNNPAILLITLERDHVIFREIVEIKDSFLVYEIPINEELSPNVFISIIMVDKNNVNQITGISQLNIKPVHKQLSIEIGIEDKDGLNNNMGIIDFVTKDNHGNPVPAELYIQACRDDYLLNDSDNVFNNFYQPRTNSVHNNYIGTSDKEEQKENSKLIISLKEKSFNNPNQAQWVRKIQTDENGHTTLEVLFPYELDDLWIKVIAVTNDLKIGYNQTPLPPGFTASIATHVPEFVTRGDEFVIGLELSNLLEFPQTLNIELEKHELQIIDNISKQVTLGVDETKKVTWHVLAQNQGLETIAFKIKNPADNVVSISRDIDVNQLPEFNVNVVNSSLSEGGEGNYYFGIFNNNSYVDGAIKTYIIPNLSSSLIAGSEKPYLESLTIEQKAWTLLALLHVEQLLQVSSNAEIYMKEKLNKQSQELVQSLILSQNSDGGWAKIIGNESDLTITAFSSWALKLSEIFYGEVSGESLSLAMGFMMNNMESPDTFEEASQFDQLAILYYVVKLLDNDSLNPNILLPYLDYFTNEGKIFLSLALEINDRGNEKSRSIIKDIERNISLNNNELIDEKDRLLLTSINTNTSRIALATYAISIIDPANTFLDKAIPLIMSAQKVPGQWDNIIDSELCLMAISKYLMGTGLINGNYEFKVFLDKQEIIQGSNTSINFLLPISSQSELNHNKSDSIYNLKFSRSDGPGTLFYMTSVSYNKYPNQILSRDSGFNIQRYYFLDENTNTMTDCFEGLCFGDNLTVHTQPNQPVQVLLIITNPKDQVNVTLEEHLPAGMKLIENSLLESFEFNNYYQSIIDMSKNAFQFQSQTVNEIKWFAEELTAGTYVVSYLLTPEYIGQFSVAPAKIWARFESFNPSWSKGQLLTIINN